MWLLDIIDNDSYILLKDKYSEDFINELDRDNFMIIYNIFIKNGFNYVNDIILKYLEIFIIDPNDVLEKLLLLKIDYGNDYVSLIGKNLCLLDKILE